MIELNKWFFVQLANFLLLLFLLNLLLFRPLLSLFKERKESVQGALEEAKRLNEKKDEQLMKFRQELSSAREEARELYSSLREEGLGVQKKLISEAHEEAMREIEKAREDIRKETENARRKLGEDVRRFSDEIVRKLVEV
ncbi:ATP synthase subunit b [bacterium BMS3Bbin06]|nr:ATP synthase subunit b [bacterium BMS3Abin08]GBE35677.1 ATP synthase subunit b [bacterium BMS3Bbin06]HDO36920.1 hypothetical protein [Nitrospirota bacterium]